MPVVFHHDTGRSCCIGGRQFLVGQIAVAVVGQHEDILAGGTYPCCPVDEVGERVGAGNLGIVGAYETVGDVCHHVCRSCFPAYHEAAGLAGKWVKALDAFEFFQLCRVVGVYFVLIVLVAFLQTLQGGELVLSADAHVAAALGVGQVELPDVLQQPIVEVASAVTIVDDGVVRQLLLRLVGDNYGVVVVVRHTRCQPQQHRQGQQYP